MSESNSSLSTCPICLGSITEAFMTSCGHSFCYVCITRHLSNKSFCPLCNTKISRASIFPNFALNNLISSSKPNTTNTTSTPTTQITSTQSTASTTQNSNQPSDFSGLNVDEINGLVAQLLERKRRLEDVEQDGKLEMLAYFLQQTKNSKLASLANIAADIEQLSHDIECVTAKRNKIALKKGVDNAEVPNDRQISSPNRNEDQPPDSQDLADKKRRLLPHLTDLENSYFTSSRKPFAEKHFKKEGENFGPVESEGEGEGSDLGDGEVRSVKRRKVGMDDMVSTFTSTQELSANLSAFSDHLSNACKFSRLNVLSSFSFDTTNTTTTTMNNNGTTTTATTTAMAGSSIVSAIDFDRDGEFFAAAGVAKKIRVYELKGVVAHPFASHFMPLHELTCRSKLSALSWNSYVKCQLAASDYEGIVWVWDVFTGQPVCKRDEHERRVWSVHFSKSDPTRLASASDDGKVKIWATNQEQSVLTLSAKANVCCVQFHPTNSNFIAYGSADHQVVCYDLRNTSLPLHSFRDHKKAVSYIKFLNDNELVSASTDSTLKLWSLKKSECVRTYTGHKNEKNFVGLSAEGDFIVCGSETNTLHTFFKPLCTPVLSHCFSEKDNANADSPPTASHFVSSVCWCPKSNSIVAGTSQGTISVLQLTDK